MKLTILGTGNALVTRCFNTCFILDHDGQCLLVDGGGGSMILSRILEAGYQWKDIRHIYVTHKHVDHIMGIVWMVRVICHQMNLGIYEGEAWIHGHDQVIELVEDLSQKLLNGKELVHLNERIHLHVVEDGELFHAIGNRFQAFDIHSTKAKQFGFAMYYEENGQEKKLTCCGDEPYTEYEKEYAQGSDWLLHEAFCLYGQADRFHPYDHHHSTVREACLKAEELQVKNLILYHTEDENIEDRKRLYEEEGRQFYHGNLYVPDDLTRIDLSTGKADLLAGESCRIRRESSGKGSDGKEISAKGIKTKRRKTLRSFFR